jgi:1-acyl-sn-glycerol-3-phosphate acyltransferase
MNGWTYQRFSDAHKARLARLWKTALAPWDLLISPEFHGMNNIPDQGPVLFVGNHSLMALLDSVLMFRQLAVEKSIVPRALGYHLHFKTPLWGRLLAFNGAVDGTRENCAAMMRDREFIVVYPGGAGEVMKRKGEQHTVRWKNRTGFARMAIENKCTIVPFSTVGADDCFDILVDNSQYQKTRIGRWLAGVLGAKPEELPPIIKGMGPTLLPRPEKMYFHFHAPIDAGLYAQQGNLDDAAWELREQVEVTVQSGIEVLLRRRASDTKRSLSSRLGQHASAWAERRFNDLLRRLADLADENESREPAGRSPKQRENP